MVMTVRDRSFDVVLKELGIVRRVLLEKVRKHVRVCACVCGVNRIENISLDVEDLL